MTATDTTHTSKTIATGRDEPRVFWLTGPCPAWCDFSRHHTDRDDGEDRSHGGVTHRVTTSTMDTDRDVVGGHVMYDDAPDASVTLRQGYREVEATIWLGRGETSQGMSFTLDEAEELAAVLLDRVKEARAE